MSSTATTVVCPVAIAGGIASGKSAAANCFHELGVPVFDADAVARELVAPGQPALAQIRVAFGDALVDASGKLDRHRLREIVFDDADARHRLESILHPAIRMSLRERAGASTAPYCILVIPLLVECRDDYDWVDRVLVVDVPRATQIGRLMQRDGTTRELAERMLATQATRAQRLALADDVIDNTGTLDALRNAVARLHRRYLALATSKVTNHRS